MLEQVRNADDLQACLDRASTFLGFDFYSISQYNTLSLGVAISSFPERWAEHAQTHGYWRHNPVAAVSRRSVSGFAWTEMRTRITLTTAQKEILRAMRAHGVANGFTVPANFGNGVSGSVSFGLQSGRAMPMSLLPAAVFIGGFAFEAYERISQAGVARVQHAPLSSRQIDCITLVARGKTDWEIGRLLGISKDTAHKHVQSAMKRLGVSSRTQLVAHALFEGHILYSDILTY